MSSDEAFAQSGNGFKISPYLQNLLLATCCESPYHLSKELLSMYLGIDISEMQLYRITDHYGAALGREAQDQVALYPLDSKEDTVYAMADGSMVLTREEQWKEAKLGRIFRGQDCLSAGRKQAGSRSLNMCPTLETIAPSPRRWIRFWTITALWASGLSL